MNLHALEFLVATSILAQTGLIAILAIYTLGLMYARRRRQAKVRVLKEGYSILIVEELMQVGTTSFKAEPVPFESNLAKDTFQLELLEQMRSVIGAERSYLENRYREMGFHQKDEKNCKSRWWSVRLKGVANISWTRFPESAPLLFDMRHDKNELVVGAALLALSSLEHPLSSPINWGSIPLNLLARRSVIYQILANACRQHGTQILFNWLESPPHPKFRDTCLQVFFTLRSIECVPLMCEFLKNPRELTENQLADIILALKTIGDPSCLMAVWPYLESQSPRLRARAGELLLELSGERKDDIINLMEQDNSREVRIMARAQRRKGNLAA